MRSITLLAALFFPVVVFASAGKVASKAQVLDLVQNDYPAIRWQKKSLKRADINCDGQIDYALLGRDGESVAVAVVIGPVSERADVFLSSLLVGQGSQDSLCGLPAVLSLEDQDYDPSEIFGEPLQGFRPSKTCMGLNVAGGECDSFHYFWNHELHILQWWRL